MIKIDISSHNTKQKEMINKKKKKIKDIITIITKDITSITIQEKES